MRILDLYDDPNAFVIRDSAHRAGDGLHEKLASMQLVDSDTLSRLPDRLFALVGTVDGEPLRKYAMFDSTHVATSVLYFLKCGGALPQEVRTKVAQNLVEACGWYGAEPPEALQKLAVVGAMLGAGLALADAPAKMRKTQAINAAHDVALRGAQLSGVKEASRGVTANTPDDAYRELESFILRGSDNLEEVFEEVSDKQTPNPFSSSPGVKTANLTGTECGVQGALSNDPRGQTPQKRFATAPKVSNWQSSGPLEFVEPAPKVAEARHHALPHLALYPIDTVEQVKRANAYFSAYQNDFTPDDRRCFAQSVAARAEELGVPVHGSLQKIAGNVYGPHIRGELQARIRCFEGSDKTAVYEVLLEQLDRTAPIVMYDMLKLADRESGVDEGYGRPVTGFREPLSAVFGAPEKPIYTWSDRGHYVTEEQLRSFSKRVPDLDRAFGDGFSTKFVDDPIKSFESLSVDKKIVIARLANQEAFRWY
jgi:hypothetical protein